MNLVVISVYYEVKNEVEWVKEIVEFEIVIVDWIVYNMLVVGFEK